MKRIHQLIAVFLLTALTYGCASNGTKSYSVGPQRGVTDTNNQLSTQPQPLGLSVIIPVMDPNIPADSDDYEKKAIWPELRRAEANRFSIQLRDALANTAAYETVRVAPDSTASAEVYVKGKILKSNGEDIELEIEVVDITGKRIMKDNFSRRIKEYDLGNSRNPNPDSYKPFIASIAAEITEQLKQLKQSRITELKDIALIRFGENFSPEYFSGFIGSSWGRTKLLSIPAEDDPMLLRIKSLEIRDQMFIDGIQVDYDNFNAQVEPMYLNWQKQAFYESKSARERQNAANAKMIFGAIAIIAGAAGASNSGYSSSSQYYGSIAAATAGVAAVASGIQDSRKADVHSQNLSELGKSLNIEIAPRVMEMEDKTIELTGTAESQYKVWRSFLLDFYKEESTPEIVL
ncbi:MAG: hypothetical protein V7708_03935 [Oceanicoccus sp.]